MDTQRTVRNAPCPKRTDFTVAWICALPIELAAAKAALDTEYRDASEFDLGTVCGHNVVLGVLPRMGTSASAAVAASMQKIFTNLQVFLLVGVGGGVPSPENDVRLGDVVVSKPAGRNGGVVQYDFGKQYPAGFERQGHMNSPPDLLLKMVNKVIAKEKIGRSTFQKHLDKFTSYPGLAKPQGSVDVLFRASYEHPHSSSDCKTCDVSQIVPREPRTEASIYIHYGTIASGNKVIKDGVSRDHISAELGDVLCFEMEAAGVMNNQSCLVIRGICDYADSHKNKSWQSFAAVTAAAYARQLLEILPSNLNEKKTEFLQSLWFEQANSRYNTISPAYNSTCDWFVNSIIYRQWLNSNVASKTPALFWVKGGPGSGKSTLMKFTFLQLKQQSDRSTIASFFFNARGFDIEQSIHGLYRSLLHQILSALPDLQIALLSVPGFFNDSVPDWTLSVLQDLLKEVIWKLESRRLILLVDALDECRDDDVQSMVEYFEDRLDDAARMGLEVKVLFASRHYPNIIASRKTDFALDHQPNHLDDVKKFVDGSLRLRDKKMEDRYKSQIVEKANGNFLWAVLVTAMVKKEDSKGRVHAFAKVLRQLPSKLKSVFEAILVADQEDIEEMEACFECILFAKRPLRPEELYGAIRLGTEPDIDCDLCTGEVDKQVIEMFLVNSSRGLAEYTDSSPQVVQLIHESVKDFLLQHKDQWHIPRHDSPHLTFQGLAHDKLKMTCLRAITLCADACAHVDLNGKSWTRPFRGGYASCYVTLYALDNVLFHADAALAAGIDQQEFLDTFPWNLYCVLRGEVGFDAIFQSMCHEGYSRLVDLVLESKVMTVYIDEERVAPGPLLQAVSKDNQEIVAMLLRPRFPRGHDHESEYVLPVQGVQGADLVKVVGDLREAWREHRMSASCLHWATISGKQYIVRLLLATNRVTVNGRYCVPLIGATVRRNHSIIKMLLAYSGIDPNLEDLFGCTAMAYALCSGLPREDTIRKDMTDLLAKFSELPRPDNERLVYDFETFTEEDLDTIRLLLAHPNFDVNAKIKGCTYLTLATKHKMVEVTKLLLADPRLVADTIEKENALALVRAAGRSSDIGLQGLLVEDKSSNN